MFRKLLIVSFILLFSSSIVLGQANSSAKPKISVGFLLGTNGGFGGELQGMVSNLTPDMPFNIRFAFGYNKLEPGVSADARRIFINDATNGVPEENGHKYDYKFDLVAPFKFLSFENSFLYGGFRYTKFVANFKYIGGNEDFDVRSNQWGFGSGLETYFSVSPKFDLLLTTGIDYMQESDLQGHDTSYSPDGVTGNERNDYTYEDADKAINQPKLEFRFMLGLKYNL